MCVKGLAQFHTSNRFSISATTIITCLNHCKLYIYIYFLFVFMSLFVISLSFFSSHLAMNSARSRDGFPDEAVERLEELSERR